MNRPRIHLGTYLRAALTDADKHQRGIILANARQIRHDIEQIFIDGAEWNRTHPNEEPVDVDPDGDLRGLADQLDAFLLAQQSEVM